MTGDDPPAAEGGPAADGGVAAPLGNERRDGPTNADLEGRSQSPESDVAADAERATARADPVVRVDDVAVAFGAASVLEGVSLTVGAGELVGLVGPNGAGKTTLLRTINGVRSPDAGRVRVAGDDVAALSAREVARRVATVPQDTTVAFEFAVEDVVAMGRTPHAGRFARDPDGPAAVQRALERTDTLAFRDRSIDSLSGGERQRVVLARALAQEAPALLLDEPTASLDVNHQVRTLELVRDLVDEDGTAALAAVHDLDLAARFCDRVVVLHDGAVLAAGTPESVLTSDTVRRAFDVDAAVLASPVTGAPTVTPVPTEGEVAPERAPTVHVVGTGRDAAHAVGALANAGFAVTVGVLPEGDVAARVAADLAADAVTTPPLSPIDADAEAAARDLLADADAAVLAGRLTPSLQALAREHSVAIGVDGGGERPEDLDAVVAIDDLAGAVERVLAESDGGRET